jgi:hypothetical protein
MGYRLQLSAEFHDWLAELRDSDPPTAVLAAQALSALSAEGDRLGPPLVAELPARLEPAELLSALDRRYQAWLESQQVLRRQVADAARTGSGEPLAEVLRAEQFIEEAQHQEAQHQEAQHQEAGAPGNQDDAAARLDEIIGQIEQEVGWPPPEGLLELRPGAPGEHTLRILFAVEPPGTALLIAVLEGPDAVREHYGEAVLLASEVLRTVRAGPAGPAEPTYADARSFLAEFFPARVDELLAAATALVSAAARYQTRSPAT